MDYGPDGQDESLIALSPETQLQARAAFRTRYSLIAARLVFVFSHGMLVITSSMSLRDGWQVLDKDSWWMIFSPVWFGNLLCCILAVYSWFASCPYIQWCLNERQARMGYSNPSILTEILPEIVMGILALIFILLALVGEVLLCRYLVNLGREDNPGDSVVPSATVLAIVAMFVACHGVCIRTNGDYFSSVGFGALATFIAALCVPGGLAGSCSWVILVPSPIANLGLLIAAIRQSRSCGDSLSRLEHFLCLAEQVTLGMVLLVLVGLIVILADGRDSFLSAVLGTSAGAGVCFIASLRATMTLVECRRSSARDLRGSFASCEETAVEPISDRH